METNMNTPSDKNTDKNATPREGKVARGIEKQTAKVPSDVFLWTAGAAILGSLALQIFGMRDRGVEKSSARPAPLASFVGMWVPSILMLGVYNKIVKVAGSDRSDTTNSAMRH